MRLTLAGNVKAGANLLDEKIPDWYTRIDIERLNMESLFYCIIGQLFSDVESRITRYSEGLEIIGINVYSADDFLFGFDCNHSHEELAKLWTKEILSRRENTTQRQTDI